MITISRAAKRFTLSFDVDNNSYLKIFLRKDLIIIFLKRLLNQCPDQRFSVL